MGLPTRVRLVILGIFLSIIVALNECKKLEGYKFPVYSTPFCPRNESEWIKRSSALNCNRTNGYTCLPNEKLTELLEFCYIEPWILIEEGYCLYLERKGSYVDSYSCRQFLHGCHNTSYLSKRIFEYPGCISIGDGCFLAEQSCNSSANNTYHPIANNTDDSSPNTTHHPKTTVNNQDDWLWVVIVMAIVGVFVCISSCMLYFYRKKRNIHRSKRRTDIEINDLEEEILLITNTENENVDCTDKGLYDSECRGNYYGSDCSISCGKCGGNGTCYKSNGICKTGCLSGYAGLSCQDKCPGTCGGDGSCSPTTLFCRDGCKPGYTGLLCGSDDSNTTSMKECSNCLQPCGSNGCIYGCMTGFYGLYCSLKCVCPVEVPCQQNNGSCIIQRGNSTPSYCGT